MKLTALNEGKWNVLSIFSASSPPARDPIYGYFKEACQLVWSNFFLKHRDRRYVLFLISFKFRVASMCFGDHDLSSSYLRFTVKSVDR